jgi:hypothetical protein
MNSTKKYVSFLNESSELEFEFLANVGKMKESIIKVVQIHEKHYYKGTKISVDKDFKKSVSDLIETSMSGKEVFTEDYLSVIKMFENKLYNDDLFQLNTEGVDESIYLILSDLLNKFNSVVFSEDRGYKEVDKLGNEVEYILKNIRYSWIYLEGPEEDAELLNDVDGIWESEEEFEKDIEGYIGKTIEDFDKSDKLRAYKYIKNKDWVRSVLIDGTQKDKEFVKNFLSQMKDLFGL